MEQDPNVPALSKFNKFISHYTLDDVMNFEIFCLGYLNYEAMVFTPNDNLAFLVNHGIIFTDEDHELTEKNKQKGYFILSNSHKVEKVTNYCNDFHELIMENIKYLEFSAYIIAFSCIALAREKAGYPKWTKKFELIYNIKYEDIKECVKYIEE